MTDLYDAALDYLTAGLHILALNGKRPNTRVHGDHWSWEDSFWGVPEGTQLAKLRANFSAEHGTTGIAILIPPGMLVADVDSEDAAQLLIDLGFVADDSTVAAQTRNGIHVWFWWPGADRNRWLGDRTLLFKGYGGYVVAPPSEHPEGGTYSWINPLVVDGVAQFPNVLPDGAIQRFTVDDQFAATNPPKPEMRFFNMVPTEGVSWWLWEKRWDYQTEGLERAIETAADGNQNNVIHWAAMKCREEGVPYNIAMERLMAAAERGHHPVRRARDTIRGAYKRASHG